MTTVGEIREAVAGLPDDAKIYLRCPFGLPDGVGIALVGMYPEGGKLVVQCEGVGWDDPDFYPEDDDEE